MIGWTLGRYFFRRYATITAWIFAGSFALVYLIDFTELSRRTGDLEGFSMQIGLAISALRVPMVMQQAVPFIALFAAMATLVSLNRKYELVIVRSAGVSAWQFLLPIALGALLFGIATVAALNPLAAVAYAKAESLVAELRSGESNEISGVEIPWIKQRTAEGETIIGAKTTLDQGLTLSDVTFFRLNAAGEIVERLDARLAHLREGHWELVEVTRLAEGGSEKLESAQIKTNLQPEFVQERLAQPEMIPFYELSGKIDAARSFGLRANAFAMQYHSLIALPLLLVAMSLIAATVSMRFTRLGQSGTMILGGILAGFLLYVVSVLVKAFGSAGIVAPVLAAWFPVIVATFFGVTFLLHKEDG
jgi:lipopolysaccharide export system permease protein